MNSLWPRITTLILLLCTIDIHANCLQTERLTGVNLAGAEFNSKKLPGVFNKDYTYPTPAEFAYIAAQGANVIRLPFRWERIQHNPMSPLDTEELERLKSAVNNAHSAGLCVVLDVHNYATYYGESLADQPQLQDAFVALWLLLANEFHAVDKTIFGLMNEPAYMPQIDWAILAKRTLAALRNAGARNRVFIGGGGWNGLHSWFNVKDGHSNAAAFATLSDPLNRTTIEVHQYADSNYSGTTPECLPASDFEEKFERITLWAQQNKLQLFLGEFGVTATADCLHTLERFLQLMQGNTWKGWTYWAAGRWWGTYALALTINTEPPAAQWLVLKRYFYIPLVNQSIPSSPPMPPMPRH